MQAYFPQLVARQDYAIVGQENYGVAELSRVHQANSFASKARLFLI